MTDPPEPVRGRAITSPPPVLRRRRGIQDSTPSAAAPRRQRGGRPGRPSSGRSVGFRADTTLRILPRTAVPSVTVAGSSRTPRPAAASSQSPSPFRRLSEDVSVIVGMPRVAADCFHADVPSVAVGGSRRRSSSAVASSAPASRRRRLSESAPAAADMGLHRAASTAHDPGALSVSAAFTSRPARGRSTRPIPLPAHGLADDVPSSCRSANDGSLVAASAARAPDRARVRGSHDRLSRTSVASVRSVVSTSPSYSAALPHGLSTGLSGVLACNIDIGPLSAEQDRDAEILCWVNGQCMICQVIRILLDLSALYCLHFLVQVLLLTCRVWILPTMILQAAGQLCLLTLLMTIFLLVIGHASILALLRVYLLRLHGLLFHMPSLQVQRIRMGISSALPLNSTQLLRMFYLMLIWTTFRMHCQLVCLGSPQHLLFPRILSARISKCVWASVVTVGWLEQAFDLEMSIFLFLMNLSPC